MVGLRVCKAAAPWPRSAGRVTSTDVLPCPHSGRCSHVTNRSSLPPTARCGATRSSPCSPAARSHPWRWRGSSSGALRLRRAGLPEPQHERQGCSTHARCFPAAGVCRRTLRSGRKRLTSWPSSTATSPGRRRWPTVMFSARSTEGRLPSQYLHAAPLAGAPTEGQTIRMPSDAPGCILMPPCRLCLPFGHSMNWELRAEELCCAAVAPSPASCVVHPHAAHAAGWCSVAGRSCWQ